MENFKSLAQKMIILLRKMWFFQFRPRSDFSLYIYEKRRISRKPFEIFTWNFKNLLVLVVSTNSAKMNNICDGGCHDLADLTWNDPKASYSQKFYSNSEKKDSKWILFKIIIQPGALAKPIRLHQVLNNITWALDWSQRQHNARTRILQNLKSKTAMSMILKIINEIKENKVVLTHQYEVTRNRWTFHPHFPVCLFFKSFVFSPWFGCHSFFSFETIIQGILL